MDIINELSEDDFKAYYEYAFPYLKIWNEETAYLKKDEVYYNYEFYNSLINNNLNNIPDTEGSTAWELVEDEEKSRFVSDTDIDKAFINAKSMFNVSLFCLPVEQEAMIQCFFTLTAFWLIKNMAAEGRTVSSDFIITSKEVGTASATYGIPATVLNNPNFSYLGGNTFGMEYLVLMLPRIKGTVKFIRGTTTIF